MERMIKMLLDKGMMVSIVSEQGYLVVSFMREENCMGLIRAELTKERIIYSFTPNIYASKERIMSKGRIIEEIQKIKKKERENAVGI